MTTPNKSEKDRVVIFDTTLRDGEQCPGATMTFEEKLNVAAMLDAMGVDVIEAGYPFASDGDFEAVREIAKRSKNAVICGLSRAALKDIDRCAEASGRPARPHPHLPVHFAGAHSELQIRRLQMVISSVTRRATIPTTWNGRRKTHPHQFDFLCRIRRRSSRPDHQPRTPSALRCRRRIQLFKRCASVKFRQGGVLGALPQRPRHGGGQLLAGVLAAHSGRCTVNGMANAPATPRSRNVMAIPCATKLPTGTISTPCSPLPRKPCRRRFRSQQYNKAIVGRNAFAHEAIHQDGAVRMRDLRDHAAETVGVKGPRW